MKWAVVYCLANIIIFAGAVTVYEHPADTPQYDLDMLQEIYELVDGFQKDVYNFWITYGPDEELGGFYTTVDQFGVPNPTVPKNIVVQGRQLYVAAALLLHKRYATEDEEMVIQLMHDQFDFIKENFRASFNDEFVYSVTPNGSMVIDDEQRIYYTEQGIWGLVHYYMAANMLGEMERANEALKMALDAYWSLHSRVYDYSYGGYDQTKEPNWFVDFGKDAFGSPDWSSGCKGYNSHLHMLEGLTGLYLASQDHAIKDLLQELSYIFMTKQYGDKPYQGLVSTCNWTHFSNFDVDYPHDMQTAHLMQDAGEALSYSNISKFEIDQKVIEIAKNVQFYGYDRVHGGIFLQGVNRLGVTIYIKAFWAQMESSLGFWRAYYVSGDSSFLETLKGILIFYRDFMQANIGEFYWEYDLYQDNTRGPDLYEPWKAAYHNSRCLLTLIEEISSFLGQ